MAEYDYQRALTRGKLKQFVSTIFRRCNALAAMIDLKNGHIVAARQHYGIEQIALWSITGSINRARDFDREFNPLSNTTYARWNSVNQAFLDGVELPPVELQKVGDEYFVRDGHHRISVARFHGAEYIDATVIDSICPVEAAELAFV